MKPLPPDTVRLLSSAQVITSVLNVVKELIENSVDAGATSIDIKLENYGLDRIEVRDNGCGIKACDTPVMAVRHYTSKICSHDDLAHLETYGFRGEALGSMCAVAEVAITTKTEDDDFSNQYSLDLTGKVVSQKPSHLGQGTTVTALKLFKNLPVRRQYYANAKKCKEELKKVQDLLMAYAIAKPDLRLTLAHNKVVVWQKAKMADHRSALVATLGSSTVANLIPCQHHQEQPEISFDAFLPKPGVDYGSTSSSSHDKTFIFVNNRPVQQKDIMKLLRQHYTAQYPSESNRNRFPVLMLKIAVPASSVDVNLTPDKTQVLLHDKEAVLTALEALLVSLYGYRCPDQSTPSERDRRSTSAQPPGSPQANVSPVDDCGSPETRLPDRSVKVVEATSDGRATGLSTDVSGEAFPDRQTANSSSSSSVADDWIVNQIPPGGLRCNFWEDDAALRGPCATEADLVGESPGRRVDGEARGAAAGKGELSAENWSKGVALTDPLSGEPLRPVKLLRRSSSPPVSGCSDSAGVGGPGGGPSKKPPNAITAKDGALTPYDLISGRVARAPPPSPAALYEKEARAEVLREKPSASLEDITAALQERWQNLGEEERKMYEEKAKKHTEQHDKKSMLASAGGTREALRQPSADPLPSRPQGQKRKAPLSNQPLLDQLFAAQPQKKKRTKGPDARPSRPLPFSVPCLRQRLHRLWSQGAPAGPSPQGLQLVNRLAPQSAWVVLCGRKLMLLNPFRVEEALLFKRLLENNILPAVSLQNPIQLTDGLLGGGEYFQALCNMDKGSPEINGGVFLADPRLVANGFKVRFTQGLPLGQSRLDVTAIADCVPFLGVEDLREILTAVLHRNAKAVQDSRPLKVRNYLQGEAVRLARQLPTNLTRQEVEDSLSRMTRQLGEGSQSCIHGRPFLQQLSVIPDTDREAKALLQPLEL